MKMERITSQSEEFDRDFVQRPWCFLVRSRDVGRMLFKVPEILSAVIFCQLIDLKKTCNG